MPAKWHMHGGRLGLNTQRPDLHQMLLILMAVHWYRHDPRRAQEYAPRLWRIPSRAKVYANLWAVVAWPLLLLPGVRLRSKWMRTTREAEVALTTWARWLKSTTRRPAMRRIVMRNELTVRERDAADKLAQGRISRRRSLQPRARPAAGCRRGSGGCRLPSGRDAAVRRSGSGSLQPT